MLKVKTRPLSLPARLQNRTLQETLILPNRPRRSNSTQFRATKQRLKHDGFWRCWCCAATENLECHHFLILRAAWPTVDAAKLLKLTEQIDIYGYGRLFHGKPLTGPDDIRLMCVLCTACHVGTAKDGAANGIHNVSWNVWITQKVAKEGLEPIPQDGEDPNCQLRDIAAATTIPPTGPSLGGFDNARGPTP